MEEYKMLLHQVTTNPESKEGKTAKTKLDFLLTKELINHNRSLKNFTIVVGIAAIAQTVCAIVGLFLCK